MKECLLHTELAFEATSKLVDMSEVAKEEARSDTTQFARMVVEKAAPKMRLDLGRSSSKIQVVKRLRVTLLNKNPLEIGNFVDSKVYISSKLRTHPSGKFSVFDVKGVVDKIKTPYFYLSPSEAILCLDHVSIMTRYLRR